uniref:Uncharacterized protein n=1 Tax=Anguilla anguilla TaxID=7936 RepID=A0A0E9U284_ANGAN
MTHTLRLFHTYPHKALHCTIVDNSDVPSFVSQEHRCISKCL